MFQAPFSKADVIGIEPKHITYVIDQKEGRDDCLVVKEVIHLKDGTKRTRLKQVENFERPFYVTHKGLQNHQEKKDYELLKNVQKYTCRQMDMPRRVAKILDDYSQGPRPQMRKLSRSPYLYGTDISSVALLKNAYRQRYPELISMNTVSGGDIETNVIKDFLDGKEVIICMSVSHKENVRLVYLKDWVADIDDPIAETHEKAKKLIGNLIKARNLKIEVLIAETPAQVVSLCIDKLHEWQPDFWAFWNMDFDMSRIQKALHEENVDPKDVFSDPTIPDKYKYFNYRQGPSQKVTASGKTMSLGFEDRWHWVTAPASFQPIDSMTVYRITRIAFGKDSSYALDFMLNKELNEEFEFKFKTQEELDKFAEELTRVQTNHMGGFIYYTLNEVEVQEIDPSALKIGDVLEIEVDYRKLKFPEVDHLKGLRWHEEMQKKYKIEYGIYNIVDSIRLEQLDEKTKDLASSISMYSKNSDYKNFNSNPKRLIDDMHFWYLNREEPCVIGSSSDTMSIDLDRMVVGADEWIITLPSYMMAPVGLACVKDFPHYRTLIFAHVADLDIVSTYPNVSQLLNIARETCVMELSQIKDIPEQWKREMGVNLTGGKTNALDICQKIMGMPSLDHLLNAYQATRVKKM